MAHRLAPQVEVERYYIARDSGGIEIADRLIASITERFWPISPSTWAVDHSSQGVKA